MTLRRFLSMFIIIALNISLAIGSKGILSTQRLYKSYCTAVKSKISIHSMNHTSWHKPHENLINSICSVMRQKNHTIYPENETLLINKLIRRIQKELYVDGARMVDLSILGKNKAQSKKIEKGDLRDKTNNWLARNKSLIKGYVGELDASNLMLCSGYKLLPCRLPNNQGMDHVFIKYARKGGVESIVIMESKYIYPGGRIKLSKSSNGIQQLSSAWVNKQIETLRESKLYPKTRKLLEKNKNKIQLHGYFTFADGQRVWRDYGCFDYKSPTCKIANRAASCCPFPMFKRVVNQTTHPAKVKKKTKSKLFDSKRQS